MDLWLNSVKEICFMSGFSECQIQQYIVNLHWVWDTIFQTKLTKNIWWNWSSKEYILRKQISTPPDFDLIKSFGYIFSSPINFKLLAGARIKFFFPHEILHVSYSRPYYIFFLREKDFFFPKGTGKELKARKLESMCLLCLRN